jgi:hypothetical protein
MGAKHHELKRGASAGYIPLRLVQKQHVLRKILPWVVPECQSFAQQA